LATKAALVPVSIANGSAALVVLLVEDEVVLRWSIGESLRDAGYTVVETASGEEAIALCKSHVSIDVIVTDINLAGAVSGWDVANYFGAHRPEVAVLYTSGKQIDLARRVSGSAFVAKPYRNDNVVSACRRLCEK
jgi:CheY-like chemotaxis protein